VGSESPLIQDAVVALGTRVTFLVRHSDVRHARASIDRAIGAIFDVHATMTLHDESPLTVLNRRGSVRPVQVPSSLIEVLSASQRITNATAGAFDASVGGRQVGMENVEVDDANRTVRLHHANTALDFNGIAKGYAVDRATAELRRSGIQHFIVNAGGDLYAAGLASPDKEGWDIHLENPQPGSAPLHHWLLSDRAVATSGNAYRPKQEDGQPRAHLTEPATGRGSRQYVSTTVIADSALEADAWSTALFVGDPAEMMRRIQKRADLCAATLHDDDQFNEIG
jgi:thiamine biosynthesis lipoprotein